MTKILLYLLKSCGAIHEEEKFIYTHQMVRVKSKILVILLIEITPNDEYNMQL